MSIVRFTTMMLKVQHSREDGGDDLSLCGLSRYHINDPISESGETPCAQCERLRLIIQREALAEAVKIFEREEAARDIHTDQ